LERIRKTKKIVSQKFSRANSKISALKQNLNDVKRKLEEITDINLTSILKNTNIPQCQTDLVFEIIKASKVKNLKNRRYSDNWMLLCLLFQIRYLLVYIKILHRIFKKLVKTVVFIIIFRSPSGYKFLRDQNILPLPCTKTIRKYLLAIKIGCGFDTNFFKLLKKKFSTKNQFERKGVLLLDEMFLRESISVNSRTLTYAGLEDMGDETQSGQNSNKKANHGLVLMWQSLCENMTQPIAVFASHGPVKGNE